MHVFFILALAAAAAAQSIPYQCYTPYGHGRNSDECSGHGACRNMTYENGTTGEYYCSCDDGWSNTTCDYKLKNRLLVFLMSFFFGTLGVDRFILGLTATAVGKLLLTTCGCFVICIGACIAACGAGLKSSIGVGAGGCIATCLGLGWGLAVFAWWLADVIMTGKNTLNDNHGYPMGPW